MSTYRFPSVLDDFGKQLFTPEQNAVTPTKNTETDTKTVQQTDPKYYKWFYIGSFKTKHLFC